MGWGSGIVDGRGWGYRFFFSFLLSVFGRLIRRKGRGGEGGKGGEV